MCCGRFETVTLTTRENLNRLMALSGEWIERAPYFEAVAVTGEGVFDTLKAVSKSVLKSLA